MVLYLREKLHIHICLAETSEFNMVLPISYICRLFGPFITAKTNLKLLLNFQILESLGFTCMNLYFKF